MFSRYHSASHSLVHHIKLLYAFIAVMALVCIFFAFALSQSMQRVRLSLPPNLEYGAEITSGNIQDYEVYVFTGYIHQQLNAWRDDGKKDLQDNIQRLRYFFSPAGQDYLNKKLTELNAKGELSKRTRYILAHEAFNPELVKTYSKNSWVVTLRYYLNEYINDIKLKDSILMEARWPVEYKDKDPEYNPWGLWIGPPLEPPQRVRVEAQ